MVGEKNDGQGEKGSKRGQVDFGQWTAEAVVDSKPRVMPAPPSPPRHPLLQDIALFSKLKRASFPFVDINLFQPF